MARVSLLESAKDRNTMMEVLECLSNRGLERLAELVFTELKSRGVHYGLDGPYAAWVHEWGMDAVGVLEVRGLPGPYTIHPTPNPGSPPYEPPSAGATGPDPDQSNRV